MSLRQLRKECEAGLADLPIPAPFSIGALVANMEAARGRTIVLHEMPDRLARVNAACGLRLKTGGTSFVLYRRRPTAYQTQHVILHELCHEWFDHGTSLDPEQLRRLLPVFDTSLISRVLGTGPATAPAPSASAPSAPPPPAVTDLADAIRSGDGTVQARAQYDTHDERMAELGASLIPRMALDVTSDDMVGRLANSLSRPVANRRRGLFRRD
ncbi:toxin [Streptomyces sp. NPDC015144]|uniref:toxin n=1 Tax=Streptomyces sp. NPDC015144 TaxID=3364944 RepID=UPI0036F731CF